MPPPAEVVIRRLAPTDWRHLKRVRLAALADAPLAFGVSLAETHALTDAHWQERAAPTASSSVSVRFLALRAGEPVGIMGVFVEESPARAATAATTTPGVPTLFTVWVEPSLRGSDLADRLLAACVDWARATGADRMLLWVWTDNARARRFYQRHGWRATGRAIPHVLDPAHTEIECELTL